MSPLAQGTGVFATTGHVARLMEKIASCVQWKEPVLLVGETGTGKTAVVQQLAKNIGVTLTVLVSKFLFYFLI